VNTQPGVWLNLAGREATGRIDPADRERVLGEVIDARLYWKRPGGGAVVARARRREEVYAGPFVERAPDVVVELAAEDGYGLSVVATPWDRPEIPSLRTLGDHELSGGRGRGMNGTHRPDGIWIAGGAGAERWGRLPEPAVLRDAAPALLGAMGVPWDAGTGGRAAIRYSEAEEAAVAERLRALGYLE
jgi:predicted AlkP superfamily phosphohydrolase/phosphomutase